MRLPVVILLLALRGLAAQDSGTHPEVFGGGRDYYPLGELGVKGLPHEAGFQIQALVERGAGEFAGLQEGDVLCRAAGEALGRDSWRRLGEILERVQSGSPEEAPPELRLELVRDGEPLTLTLTVPRRQPHTPACREGQPRGCAGCQELAALALRRLLAQQRADGAFPAGIGGPNGHCVVTGMTVLALLAAGETGKGGEHDQAFRRAIAYLGKEAGNDPLARRARRVQPSVNWNQTHWAWSWTGIATGYTNLARRDSRIRSLGSRAARELLKGQLESGGWGHGPGGLNALGYQELWAVSGQALLALGLARRAGTRLPEEELTLALGYLGRCVQPSGGMGYGPGTLLERTPDTSRTALALLALASLERCQEEPFEALASWFGNHLGDLHRSHQGYLLQLALAALAARELGPGTARDFWRHYRHGVLLAHCGEEEGWFTTIPTPESRAQALSNDIGLGRTWATAVHALLLHLPEEHLPRLRQR